MRCHSLLVFAAWFALAPVLPAQDAKPVNAKIKEIAGTAEFLRHVPKRFATLKAIDAAQGRVTILLEGESLPKVWPLIPDAELKVAGWWARLEHFTLGARVWIWFKTDRTRQPVAISMLADELSEQDMHGPGVTLVSREAGSLSLKPVKEKAGNWSIKVSKAEVFRGKEKVPVETLQAGSQVFTQSSDGQARLVLDAAALELRRAEQKSRMKQVWTVEGLPGTVAFAHVFSGEMDLLLDHEAMRWGRSLKPGEKVTLPASPPINAVVKHVQAWRERTQVRLVVHSFDLADLANGQRLMLKMTPPSEEIQVAQLPPDLGKPREKADRIDWFLASIYCTCKIKGDGCTGHFYSLASCNPNGCGMPNHMRKVLAGLIEKGLTDEQIFRQLLTEHGPDLLRPHLLP